jgi:cilla- and flagella-associated protein
MSKPMTLELVHLKTKNNRLETIKQLNLWGNDLDDIQIVQQMQALETLSLAVNKVTSLRDIQGCKNLRELYMRNNKLTSLVEIPKYLSPLRYLKKLSLNENPFCDHAKYRAFVIKSLPQLESLDNQDVTSDERRKIEAYSLEDLLAAGGGAGVGVSYPSE